MERYVLRFRGPSAPDDQVTALRQRVKVVDASAKQLLIETGTDEAERLKADFPQWMVAKEITYTIPERPIRASNPPKP